MEGHRRYPDEPEPVWYSGPGQYPAPSRSPYDPDVHERPSGAVRLPEQRDGEYVQRDGEYPPRDSQHPPRDGYPGPDGEYAQRDGERSPRDAYPQREGGYAHRDGTRPDAEYPERGGEHAQRDAEFQEWGTDYAPSSHYATPDPVISAGSGARSAPAEPASAAQESVRIPVRGPEYPTIRPAGTTALDDAPPPTAYGGGSSAPASAPPEPGPATVPPVDDPTGLVPPIIPFAPEPKPSDSVYRTRRPVSAVLVAVGTALLLVPALLLLIRATFVDDPVAGGVVPAVLLTLGLPLTGLGLYAMAGGGPVGRDAWLRPPIVYLPIGLVLLLTAGLAVA